AAVLLRLLVEAGSGVFRLADVDRRSRTDAVAGMVEDGVEKRNELRGEGELAFLRSPSREEGVDRALADAVLQQRRRFSVECRENAGAVRQGSFAEIEPAVLPEADFREIAD